MSVTPPPSDRSFKSTNLLWPERGNDRRHCIGIDFDNTIISYRQAFLAAAKRRALLPENFVGTKQAVRDCIRLLRDGEREWMDLQGFVYGRGIVDAVMMDGLATFLRRCREEGDAVVIVSHKTEFGHFDPSNVNLRHAALDWMSKQGFFHAEGFGLAVANVYFESTRREKLARIAALGCSHFIDDLEEVLGDPEFPASVKRILFTEGGDLASAPKYPACATWREIEELVFNERV